MRQSIYLTGFMGAGKTVTGRLLADSLNLPFLDLDDAIEAREGLAIAAIFAHRGEAYFRRCEVEVLANPRGPAVVALGGGTPMSPAAREVMSRQGLSVYLDWPVEVLIRRVGDDPARPLAGDPAAMARRFRDRLPVYRQADLIWRSRPPHRESPAEVAAAISSMLRIEKRRRDGGP